MKIPMEDWLRGCVYHDGRHGEVTLSTDKVLEIADYIQLTRTSLADGMIELPPYEPKDDPFDKDINVRSKDEPQTCSVSGRPYGECADCEHFKCTADEPQTEYERASEQREYDILYEPTYDVDNGSM